MAGQLPARRQDTVIELLVTVRGRRVTARRAQRRLVIELRVENSLVLDV